jgi:transposase
VTAAGVTDRNGAVEIIKINRDSLSKVRKFLCDGEYSGKNFAGSVMEINGAPVKAVKRNELREFAVLPKRRVVGRSFGWLDKVRRLRKKSRAETSYFASNGDSGLYCGHVEKILNRL